MKKITQDFLDIWGSVVARSASTKSDVVAYYRSLIFLFDNQEISDYQLCSGLAWPVTSDVAIHDDSLNDIATEAASFEIPDGNPAAVGDRVEHIQLLRSLISNLK